MNYTKNIFILLCSITFLLLIPSCPIFCAPVPAGGLGDVNSDTEVDIVDALLVARYYVGFSVAIDTGVANVNCDNGIDIVDALLIAQYYVGLLEDLACSAPEPTQIPVIQFEDDQSNFSDQEVIDAMYHPDYVYPDHFYSEDNGDAYMEYMSSYSIVTAQERPDYRIEFCTDDRNEAYQWSVSTAEIFYFLTVDTGHERETEKFFEFTWEFDLSGTMETVLYRTHKCSYVDLTSYDIIDPDSFLVYFNLRPLTAANVKEVIEYLWINRSSGKGEKILSSYVLENSDVFYHMIFTAYKQPGDWGLPDMIHLEEYVFTIDKSNGEIIRDQQEIRVIQGNTTPYPY